MKALRLALNIIAATCTIILAWTSLHTGQPLHWTGAVLVTLTSLNWIFAEGLL